MDKRFNMQRKGTIWSSKAKGMSLQNENAFQWLTVWKKEKYQHNDLSVDHLEQNIPVWDTWEFATHWQENIWEQWMSWFTLFIRGLHLIEHNGFQEGIILCSTGTGEKLTVFFFRFSAHVIVSGPSLNVQ